MSTPTPISVPNKEDLATVRPSAGHRYITGKVSIVDVHIGGTVVVIAGGQNPGQYQFSPKVNGSVEAALAAMNNKNHIWAVTEDDSLDIVAFAVYGS